MRQQKHFVLDAMAYWQSVQFLENWSDVTLLAGTSQHSVLSGASGAAYQEDQSGEHSDSSQDVSRALIATAHILSSRHLRILLTQ